MEIELTKITHKAFKINTWVIDLIQDDKISTASFDNKFDALQLIKQLELKHGIKGFKRCKDEIM